MLIFGKKVFTFRFSVRKETGSQFFFLFLSLSLLSGPSSFSFSFSFRFWVVSEMPSRAPVSSSVLARRRRAEYRQVPVDLRDAVSKARRRIHRMLCGCPTLDSYFDATPERGWNAWKKACFSADVLLLTRELSAAKQEVRAWQLQQQLSPLA